jgi:pimeloyl-ACP methyl ester carboxylesterase
MRIETINGADICIDTIGDPKSPAILLIHGAGASMDRWDPTFCARLAQSGRYVIRYDHRDTGQSTTYEPGNPPYTGDDLVEDALGILDTLKIDRAHIVGISMGGGIAQHIALRRPHRVRSLTLMSTSPATTGGPKLPSAAPGLFVNEPPEPDWQDRDATVAYLREAERPYAGSRDVDEAALERLLRRVYDRSTNLASASNHYAAGQGGDDPHWDEFADIDMPTLVIHGTDDPLFPPAHGEALAAQIPGADLLILDGVGHEFPPSAHDEVLPALIANTR